MVQVLGQVQKRPNPANQGMDFLAKVIGERQQQQQMAEALKSQGIDPRVMNLPPEAQAAYFKQAFAQEKQLTPLQEAQKNLAEERLRALQGQQDLFKQLSGQGFQEKPQGMLGGESESSQLPDSDKKFLAQMPEENLNKLAAFAGQPGQAGIIGNIAKGEQERRKEEKSKLSKEEEAKRKSFESDREYHSKVSRPVIEGANERLKNSAVSKGLREQLKRDIASGNTSGFFPFMVDKLGLASFQNPESARFSNEIKNLFVESLNDIPGARPNMFLERVLSNAQPLIGRSPEANLSVMDVADFIEDLKDQQAKMELQIAKEDREKLGYVREDVVDRARERMGDYANRRQEQMAMTIRKRTEDKMDDAALIHELLSGDITPGTYITPRIAQILMIRNNNDKNKAIEEAKSLGLIMPQYLGR